jgi:prevent-host-death family protein
MIQKAPTTESVSSFKEHIDEALKRLANTDSPIILTEDGRPTVVVQDALAYDRLIEKAERVDVLLAVKEGLEEIARGQGLDVDAADDQLRRELGLPPRQ